jgi:hypothetical protein
MSNYKRKIEYDVTNIDEPVNKKIMIEDEPTDINDDSSTEIDKPTDIDDEPNKVDDEPTDIDDKPTNINNEPNKVVLFNPLILLVTTHGAIYCDKDNNYEITTIPEDFELIKISISSPGIVNCCSKTSVTKYLIIINNLVQSLLNYYLNDDDLNDIIEYIKNDVYNVHVKKTHKLIEKL